jgi:hypothetical protein
MRAHYPSWDITKGLETTFQEIYEAWRNRNAGLSDDVSSEALAKEEAF